MIKTLICKFRPLSHPACFLNAVWLRILLCSISILSITRNFLTRIREARCAKWQSNSVCTLFTMLMTFLPLVAFATNWQLVPKDSSLVFVATQNGSPVKGQFRSFTGEIHFDPAKLDTSNVNIVIDIASVTTSYKDIADTLQTPDWFDIKVFPKAFFTAKQFSKTADKTYQAAGNLTIRNKTVPVLLTFTLDEYSADKAHATGSTTLKRSAFGIGRGEWSSTDSIKDEVQVNFILSVIKK